MSGKINIRCKIKSALVLIARENVAAIGYLFARMARCLFNYAGALGSSGWQGRNKPALKRRYMAKGSAARKVAVLRDY